YGSDDNIYNSFTSKFLALTCSGGGGYTYRSNLVVKFCKFEKNDSRIQYNMERAQIYTGCGGGLMADDSNITLLGNDFLYNRAYSAGIDVYYTKMILYDNIFRENNGTNWTSAISGSYSFVDEKNSLITKNHSSPHERNEGSHP